MDGFELNKILGALTGALGVYVALGIVVDKVYHVGGHHGEEHAPAYALALESADEGAGEAVEAVPLETLLAAATPEAGARVFAKCKSCHSVEDGGKNGVGPNLWGVVGADIAVHAGFGYSDALLGVEGVWDFAALNGFLEAPKAWAPGTAMGFAGLGKPEDRAAVIVYLNQQSAAPLPLPAAEAAPAPTQ